MIPIETRPDGSLFKRNWATYRKMVNKNYLFHQEAYAVLRDVLKSAPPPGFRFLDIACGDATESARALRGLPIGHYHGIDFSSSALDLAEMTLRTQLDCGFELIEEDYMTALGRLTESYHAAWVGLSLHHLRRPEKLAALTQIARLLSSPEGNGILLVYENTSPDGEEPAGWHARWDAQRLDWTTLDGDEWEAVTAHVHREDHPETVSSWRRLGTEAGFQTIEQLYASPTDLFRLFAFR